MGNPRWSYEDMVREADRIITESMKVDEDTPIEDLELRLESYKHDSEFYFNCGIAVANVSNDISENGGCDEFNAAIDGFEMFRDLIGLEETNVKKCKRNEYGMVICPDCHAIAFAEDSPKWLTCGYCFRCGQKLDWSEDENE